ncbi:MAG: hypothetical protein ABI619_05930, partial [Betaproteobacteria bacterium]
GHAYLNPRANRNTTVPFVSRTVNLLSWLLRGAKRAFHESSQQEVTTPSSQHGTLHGTFLSLCKNTFTYSSFRFLMRGLRGGVGLSSGLVEGTAPKLPCGNEQSTDDRAEQNSSGTERPQSPKGTQRHEQVGRSVSANQLARTRPGLPDMLSVSRDAQDSSQNKLLF